MNEFDMGAYTCHTCQHCRQRLLPELHLMSPTADNVRVQIEWNAEWSRREHDEWQRFVAGDVFVEQPFFYRWCVLFTRLGALQPEARDRLDGRGRRVRHYVLCAAVNRDGACRGHSDLRREHRHRRRSTRSRPR